MNGVRVAVLLILGLVLLAIGLVVVALPLLSSIAVSLLGLIGGGICIVVGAFSLWLARHEGNHERAPSSSGNRAFFAVLAAFNLLIAVLCLQEGQWPSLFVAVGAGLIAGLLINTVARRIAER